MQFAVVAGLPRAKARQSRRVESLRAAGQSFACDDLELLDRIEEASSFGNVVVWKRRCYRMYQSGALIMIHYTCDCCKRVINGETEMRYVVRVEVYASLDAVDEELEDERDHLQEIQEYLERMDDEQQEAIGDEVYHQTRYDLCSECRRRYVKNPLGRVALEGLGFSQN